MQGENSDVRTAPRTLWAAFLVMVGTGILSRPLTAQQSSTDQASATVLGLARIDTVSLVRTNATPKKALYTGTVRTAAMNGSTRLLVRLVNATPDRVVVSGAMGTAALSTTFTTVAELAAGPSATTVLTYDHTFATPMKRNAPVPWLELEYRVMMP